MATARDPIDVRRHAGWLPGQDDLEAWLGELRERADARRDRPLHPVVQELADLVAGDPVLRMYVHRMIEQEPVRRGYSTRHLDGVEDLWRLVDLVLTMAPEYSDRAPVVTPLGAVLDWTMATPAGFAAYRDRRLNDALEKVLDAWCTFLDGPDSRYVLDDGPGGWRSEPAREAVGIDQFEYDPTDEYWGFSSWNDFFTRRFKEGARPVAAPDDDDVIVSACESFPYGLSTDVRLEDEFWVKSQPYSLADMLGDRGLATEFAGGTVYQAFLSATQYHRWHSPVAGTVVAAHRIPGTYYSESDAEGADAAEPRNSQGYLAHVATRMVIVIDADNPLIGRVAVVQVGMSDVSSVVLHPDVAPGTHVRKGDELGHFQFGGSTWCLVLRPGLELDFALGAVPQPHDPQLPLVLVRSRLATVRGSRTA